MVISDNSLLILPAVDFVLKLDMIFLLLAVLIKLGNLQLFNSSKFKNFTFSIQEVCKLNIHIEFKGFSKISRVFIGNVSFILSLLLSLEYALPVLRVGVYFIYDMFCRMTLLLV